MSVGGENYYGSKCAKQVMKQTNVCKCWIIYYNCQTLFWCIGIVIHVDWSHSLIYKNGLAFFFSEQSRILSQKLAVLIIIVVVI
jgi:hypothetical protein